MAVHLAHSVPRHHEGHCLLHTPVRLHYVLEGHDLDVAGGGVGRRRHVDRGQLAARVRRSRMTRVTKPTALISGEGKAMSKTGWVEAGDFCRALRKRCVALDGLHQGKRARPDLHERDQTPSQNQRGQKAHSIEKCQSQQRRENVLHDWVEQPVGQCLPTWAAGRAPSREVSGPPALARRLNTNSTTSHVTHSGARVKNPDHDVAAEMGAHVLSCDGRSWGGRCRGDGRPSSAARTPGVNQDPRLPPRVHDSGAGTARPLATDPRPDKDTSWNLPRPARLADDSKAATGVFRVLLLLSAEALHAENLFLRL